MQLQETKNSNDRKMSQSRTCGKMQLVPKKF